jgi:hypothetical protein
MQINSVTRAEHGGEVAVVTIDSPPVTALFQAEHGDAFRPSALIERLARESKGFAEA